jgi:isopenicillin N synthase-like dioxygenase
MKLADRECSNDRYMQYQARSPEINEKYRGIYTNGHTDFGSLTLLFRQPIAALQIKTSDGSWKWVKPYPESECFLNCHLAFRRAAVGSNCIMINADTGCIQASP